jgi:hypothetical protein
MIRIGIRSKIIGTTSEISKCSDEILMALVSSSRPAEAIFRHYEEAEDKDVFIAGLIGVLLLKHRQWQAAIKGGQENA